MRSAGLFENEIPPRSHAPQRNGAATTIAGGLLFLMLLASSIVFIFWLRGAFDSPLHDPTAEPRIVVPGGDLAVDERTTIELFKQVSPSVVNITTLGAPGNGVSFAEAQAGTGSGFVWDSNGYVVTNYHVVQNAKNARVTLADSSTWTARLVGADADQDIAVLKIDAPRDRLPPIAVGSSQELAVGQKVFAIGNPFGLDQTLTTGVISGVGRQIRAVTQRTIEGVIQTDAAINPGNSGGPLLDSSGRLIGINTAIFSPSGTFAGIGFAVPVDAVNQVVPKIIREGTVERPGLGIYVYDDSIAKQLDVKGVLVRRVIEGGAAAKAGIRETRYDPDGEFVLGDVIVAIDGRPVEKTADLLGIIREHTIGDAVTVTVERDDEKVELDITLEPLPMTRP